MLGKRGDAKGTRGHLRGMGYTKVEVAPSGDGACVTLPPPPQEPLDRTAKRGRYAHRAHSFHRNLERVQYFFRLSGTQWPKG